MQGVHLYLGLAYAHLPAHGFHEEDGVFSSRQTDEDAVAVVQQSEFSCRLAEAPHEPGFQFLFFCGFGHILWVWVDVWFWVGLDEYEVYCRYEHEECEVVVPVEPLSGEHHVYDDGEDYEADALLYYLELHEREGNQGSDT